MIRLLSLVFVLLFATTATAQTFLSASSHKQGAATSQSITADGTGTAIDITGYSQVLLTVRGTYALATTGITFEVSPDATNYFAILGHRVDDGAGEVNSGALTNTTRSWRFNTTGFTRFRTNSDWTSGTASITITPVSAPTTATTSIWMANQLDPANDTVGISITAAGGLTPHRRVSTADTNAANIKASAGILGAVIASNVNAAARYIHFYNTAGTPTCNASIINTFIIPGDTAGGGTNIPIPVGAVYGTGIGICITTAADGTGSVAAGEIVVNTFYR